MTDINKTIENNEITDNVINKSEATPGDKFSPRRLLASIRIWDAYYSIIAICYILTVYTAVVRPGVIGSAFMLLIGACVALDAIRKEKSKDKSLSLSGAVKNLFKRMNICDAFMIAFVIYNVISVIWMVIFGMPVSIYAGELVTFILPAVFYMVGRIGNTENGFYSGYLWGLIIICAIGLIYYILAPQVYLNYLYDWSYISLADAPTMRVRMNSVVGSTILGSMSAAGMLAAAAVFRTGKHKALSIAGFFTGFVFAVLSNQRSAMVVALVIALYINVLVFFTFKLFKKKYFYIECGAIVAILIVMMIVVPSVVMKVYYRLVSLPQAIGERSEQWVAAVNMMHSSWIGNGLGANGHRAIGIDGVKVIADGGLVKMFCELGVVGFAMFAYLMLLVVKRGMKVFAQSFAEIGIIAIFILQSVGSNVLSFQLVTPVFWYAVGRLAFLGGGSCEDNVHVSSTIS